MLIILFSFINDSFTANNITNIILQVSIIAITAYGMTYVLCGDIDLSVGSTIALIGTFAALGASWEFHLFYWSHYPLLQHWLWG